MFSSKGKVISDLEGRAYFACKEGSGTLKRGLNI